jgi:hypothetical protein
MTGTHIKLKDKDCLSYKFCLTLSPDMWPVSKVSKRAVIKQSHLWTHRSFTNQTPCHMFDSLGALHMSCWLSMSTDNLSVQGCAWDIEKPTLIEKWSLFLTAGLLSIRLIGLLHVGCVNSLIEFRLPRNRQPTLKRPNKSERQSTGYISLIMWKGPGKETKRWKEKRYEVMRLEG